MWVTCTEWLWRRATCEWLWRRAKRTTRHKASRSTTAIGHHARARWQADQRTCPNSSRATTPKPTQPSSPAVGSKLIFTEPHTRGTHCPELLPTHVLLGAYMHWTYICSIIHTSLARSLYQHLVLTSPTYKNNLVAYEPHHLRHYTQNTHLLLLHIILRLMQL